MLRISAGGVTIDRTTSEPYSNDNCDRLITQSCKSTSWRLSSVVLALWLLLGKVNDGTLSGDKCLPSVLTKCLLQVRVWQFSRRFVCLMTWTQCFSILLFFIERKKSYKWRSLLDLLEHSQKQQHWNILQQHTLFNVLPPRQKFLFSWSIIVHKSHPLPRSIVLQTWSSAGDVRGPGRSACTSTSISLSERWTLGNKRTWMSYNLVKPWLGCYQKFPQRSIVPPSALWHYYLLPQVFPVTPQNPWVNLYILHFCACTTW